MAKTVARKSRTFSDVDPLTIVRPQVFAIGLYGYTGTGKTKSALELATGIQRVYGGDLFFADADGGRGLHFRKEYPGMRYIDFLAPHNALDYADLISSYENRRGVLVIDQMTHEHDGEDGLLDTHAAEKERRGGDDSKNTVAWALAKSQHKVLARTVRRVIQSLPLVICWRAQDKTNWNNKEEGRVKPVPLGEMPIGSMDLPFEMTATYLLPVGSRGVPCLKPDAPGERLMTKIPDQFIGIVKPGEQFRAEHGEAMARWAMEPCKPFYRLMAAIERATAEDIDALAEECKAAVKNRSLTPAEAAKLSAASLARREAIESSRRTIDGQSANVDPDTAQGE
jgi:hypothetical protein